MRRWLIVAACCSAAGGLSSLRRARAVVADGRERTACDECSLGAGRRATAIVRPRRSSTSRTHESDGPRRRRRQRRGWRRYGGGLHAAGEAGARRSSPWPGDLTATQRVGVNGGVHATGGTLRAQSRFGQVPDRDGARCPPPPFGFDGFERLALSASWAACPPTARSSSPGRGDAHRAARHRHRAQRVLRRPPPSSAAAPDRGRHVPSARRSDQRQRDDALVRSRRVLHADRDRGERALELPQTGPTRTSPTGPAGRARSWRPSAMIGRDRPRSSTAR